MPVTPDAITLKRLVLVKQLYQHALVQASGVHSYSRRIMAVVGFDLAIETTLKAVVCTFDQGKPPADAFASVLKQCDDLLAKAQLGVTPDRANILHIHSIRNDAQHKAKYPNETDVSDCRTYARDFLQKIVLQVWGLSFEGISLTDLVQDAEVKSQLVDAETALSNNNYEEAVEHAAVGLQLAIWLVKTAVVGRNIFSGEDFLMMNKHGRTSKSTREATAFNRMQETLIYLALGMDFAEYTRQKQIAGHVIVMLDGSHHYLKPTRPIEVGEAEFVVAYCINSVLEIENRVGNLDAPFGREDWD